MNFSEEESGGSVTSEALAREVLPETFLKQLLWMTAVTLILSDVLFLLGGRFSVADWEVNLAFGLVLLLGARLVQTGRILWAARGYTFIFWLSLTLLMVFFGAERVPTPGSYILAVLLAALLLRGWATLFYTLLSFIAGALLTIGHFTGYIPLPQPVTHWGPTINTNFPKAFFILTLLGISFYALRFTMATLRFNEFDLKQIRQTLVQRTEDLFVMNQQLRHEIAERQQTEIALAQQHAFLRQIIDTIPHFVFVKDKHGRFRMINKALADIYKSTPAIIEGQSSHGLNPHTQEIDLFDRGDQIVLDSLQEHAWSEIPFTDLDGEIHWLQVVKRPLFDQAQNDTLVLGVATDITLVKATTEALREKEENFRTLVEASFEGIIVCRDHIIQEANIAFATMFGYNSTAEVIGRHAATFLTPESVARLQKTKQEERKVSLEVVGVRRDHSTIPVELISRPINYQGQLGQITGYRDITARKQAEEAEQQAQKLASLRVMAGGLAHDFNNLLVAMMGQIAIAKARLNPEHPSHDNLDKATQATETAALLTRQLLAYTGQGHFEVTTIHLNELITKNLEIFQEALPANITFHTNLREPLPHIQADAVQIQQIIMNLLLNAAEAIGTQPGSIIITTSPYELTSDQICHWQQTNETVEVGNFVRLEIADTGCGMDEATQTRIFDPFYTTKGTGRGLGLAAVLGIMRGHKGSLRTQSQVGQGTSFEFLFPSEEFTETARETAVSPAPPQSRQNTVLIIDDEQQVREAIRDILDLEEIAVLTAASGLEGIATFEANQNQIGLIILDLSMPGMSGIETFTALRGIDPAAKIILSSGYTETEILQKMAGTRPTGFLQKPYRLETVLLTAEKHLA